MTRDQPCDTIFEMSTAASIQSDFQPNKLVAVSGLAAVRERHFLFGRRVLNCRKRSSEEFDGESFAFSG